MEENPTDDNQEPEPSFSVIKFIKLFEKAVRKLERSAKLPSALTIQADAYSRLGGTPEEDQHVEQEVIAQYLYIRKDTDTTLLFSIAFFEDAFFLDLESCSQNIFVYDDCFKDEKQAVEQLIVLITFALNGQLSVLQTLRHGRWCASELVLRQPGSKPVILLTETNYPRFLRSKETEGYDFTVLKNKYDLPEQALPSGYFMCDYGEKGGIVARGRSLKGGLAPLTKGDFETFAIELSLREGGKKPEETDWQLFYRSWEFWAVIVGVSSAAIVMSEAGWLPAFVADYPIVLLPINSILCYTIILPYLRDKERRKELETEERGPKLWRIVKSNPLRVWLGVLYAVPLILTAVPMFDEKGVRKFVDMYTLSQHHPWMLLVPFLLVVALSLLGWKRRTAVTWSLLSASVAGFVALWANTYIADQTFPAPDPYATMFLTALYLIWIVTFVMVFREGVRFARRRLEATRGQTLERIYAAHVVLSFVSCGLGLVGLGMFGSYLEQDMLSIGSPYIVMFIMLLSLAAFAMMSILLWLRRVTMRQHYWVQLGYLFVVLGITGFATNEKIENIPDLPWAVVYVSIFVPIVTMLWYMYVNNKEEQSKINEKYFDEA